MKLVRKLGNCLLAVALLLGAAFCAEEKAKGNSQDLDKARRITGHFREGSEIKNIAVQPWNPLNDADRAYVGPTKAEPSKWFKAKEGKPEAVGCEDDLHRLLYELAYNLEPEYEIKLDCGVTKNVLEKWLKKCSNSLYGGAQVIEKDDKLKLQIGYSTEARIMAAFRNPELQNKLEEKEAQVLETCAQWIVDNIQEGMPNGLKLTKIHDALVDNSKYTKGCYTTAEIILEGKGVCAAYTSASQLLLHMVKIDCRRVMGTKKMNHTWNMVDVNGAWYHMDVTWDDPIGGADRHMYTYFLLTDEEMDVDHDWVDKDSFEPTQKLNTWHFNKRNLLKRSWAQNSSGYTLPREDDSVAQNIYDMHAKQAADRGEAVANLLGIDIQRSEQAEKKVKVDDPKGSGKDLSRIWSKSLPKLKRLKKDAADDSVIQDVRDFNRQLGTYVNQLAGPELVFQCKKDMPEWEMRKIVATSDISTYAEAYNAIYDAKKFTITIELEYWTHIRLLTAAGDEKMLEQLTPKERKALKECQAWAEAQQSIWQRSKQKATNVYAEIMRRLAPIGEYSTLADACSSGKSNSLGYAQAMYVALNLCELPCIMAHGRTKEGDHVWNMVRTGKRDWYHADSMLEDYHGNKAGGKYKYFLKTDDETREEHVWDPQELPRTPRKGDKKSMGRNPFMNRF